MSFPLPSPLRIGLQLTIATLSLLILSCRDTDESTVTTSTAPAGVIVPEGMCYIPETTYLRGNERELGTRSKYPEEAPVHKVQTPAFLLDATEVTNAQFLEFIEATGYLTQAEKGLSKEEFPHAPADQIVPGSSIFTPPAEVPELWNEDSVYQWWTYTPGADWRHPLGPGSEMALDHPVVCITNADARAYAKWAGKRLPTEAEWEAAARAGEEQKLFTWGDTPKPDDQWMSNTYQGTFPTVDSAKDGFASTSPVKSFPPNAYGLYDMAGNVWEHTSDLYSPTYYQSMSKGINVNPVGPEQAIDNMMINSLIAGQPLPEGYQPFHELLTLYSTKGGSFLCHHTYCLRYRPAARSYSEGLSPTNHTGFRCAKDIE